MIDAVILDRKQARCKLAKDFADGHAAFLFVDVQYDYFDYMRLRIRGASEKNCALWPVVADRIRHFRKDVDKTAPGLTRIWAVHAYNRQLQHCARNPESLRTELVVETDPAADRILVKRAFCSFSDTDLDRTLEDSGVQTLVIGGGILENCVASTIHTAMHRHKKNVVLMPDLTTALDGIAGPRTRRRLGVRETLPARGMPWLSMVPSTDVRLAMMA